MKQVLHHLKKYTLPILACLALLCVQAYCDLSLPEYMSNIVNVGIQQGGIDSIVSERLRAEDMEALELFMTADEKETILSYYSQEEINGDQMYVLGKLYNPREMAAKAKAELEAQREAERQEKIEARKAAKEKQAEKNRQAAEAAKAGKKRNAPVEVEEETLIDLVESDEVDEKALSQKEINRMKLAAARRRDAERYGEEYVEVSDKDLE